MAKKFACALTHVRHESFFLAKWIAHYGSIVGRENLYVVIDGDDWQPDVDLDGIHVEIILGAPRQRIRNDRWIAREMSERANKLRKTYDFVIRGDVDEYVVIDPSAGLDWPEAFFELGDEGYIFALGVDMVQAPSETKPLDPARPILSQRRHGFVSDRYSKPFVISRWNNWSGGAHRLLNRDVRLSNHFFLFHMALCDRGIAQQRMQARGGVAQHVSFVDHQSLRLDALDQSAETPGFGFDDACRIGHAHFPRAQDGSTATRPRPADVPGAQDKGLYVKIPHTFSALV